MFLSCTLLQGCAATIYNWSDIPDKNEFRSLSANEKVEYYNHYAIDKLTIYPFGGHGIGFSTLNTPDKVYDLYTYSPVIYQIAPETQAIFEEALFWERNQLYSGLGMLAVDVYAIWAGFDLLKSIYIPASSGTSLTSDQFSQNLVPYVLICLGGLAITGGLSYYFMSKEMEQYEKIRTSYNKSLYKMLELKIPLSLDQDLPLPTFAIVEVDTQSGLAAK